MQIIHDFIAVVVALAVSCATVVVVEQVVVAQRMLAQLCL